jgi:predicted permease
MAVLRGRSFRDRDAAERVALVNEAFAHKFWPDGDALGRHIDRRDGSSFEVVGIVKDGKFRGFREDIHPSFYIPLQPDLMKQATLEVRSAGNVANVLLATRARLRELDPDLPVETQTLHALIDTSLSQERLMASLVSGLGALALSLAAIGIYGVISFHVARRTREIGIRVALGATSGDVRRMVLRQVLVSVGIGIALGLACAAAATRLIASMLYGVRATDIATYAGAVALLAATAAAAAYIPARRAARVEPLTALRLE